MNTSNQKTQELFAQPLEVSEQKVGLALNGALWLLVLLMLVSARP
jgi:hypothetical protein